MKSFATKLSMSGNNFLKKLPSSNKLPFFTLSFTLAALVVTIIAVQQQQNLIQEAAKREPCEGENSIVVTKGPKVSLVVTHTETPPSIISSENAAPNRIPGQFIVKYKNGGNKKSVEDKVKKRKGKVKKRLEKNRMDIIQVPANEEKAMATEIQSDSNIEYVQYDYYIYEQYTPNDPEFKNLWGLHNTGQNGGKDDVDIDAPEAWDITKGDKSVTIAVIDSGIDVDHPDLKGQVVDAVDMANSGSTKDERGHGTHVAGIIAALGNNDKGVIGACPECSLVSVKVLDGNGRGSVGALIEGINWAVEKKVDIINMSLGAGQDPSQLQGLKDAVDQAVDAGILVVAAAGNCGGNGSEPICTEKDKVTYPGGYEDVLTVGGIDKQGKKYQLSGIGEGVDVAAPAVEILSTLPGNQYGSKSGTSMATPYVAGIAGLLMAKGSNAQEAMDKITNTSEEIEGSGTLWAHGLVNAAKALGGDGGNGGDNDNPDASSGAKPDKNPKPTKPCKPAKDKNKDKDPKPTKAPSNNGTKNPDKGNANNNGNSNSGNSQNPACRLMPYLPFCKSDDCVNNPSNNGNNNTGNGRDGQENTSNNPSNVNIGNIDNDGTSDTKINVNGRDITSSSDDEGGNGEDINTGGKTGGNNKTEINIDKNGQNQNSNQGGSNGNQPNNSGGNTGGCGSPDTSNGNKKDTDKSQKNDKQSNNGGNNTSLLCRLAPFLGRCNDDKKRQEEEKKKKDDENKKKADDDKKKKDAEEKKKKDDEAKKKKVKGVSTVSLANAELQTLITECMKNPPYPSDCTPDDRAVADTNQDGKVTSADRTVRNP